MTERTLILIKPDAVQRQLVGKIIDRYEARGLRIAGMKLMHADRALAEQHYAEHKGKPFFAGLVEFITSAPLVAMCVEGPNAIAVCRDINGKTRPHEAAPGSIRGAGISRTSIGTSGATMTAARITSPSAHRPFLPARSPLGCHRPRSPRADGNSPNGR